MEKILIVDDEKNIRLTLSTSLESSGFEMDMAINGEEALMKVQQKDYTVILLDIRLPGMNGIEVLRRIRHVQPKTRVVMITAYGSVEYAVEAMKLGAVDFLQKPFTPDQIRSVVNQIINRKKLNEENAKDYYSLLELSKRQITDKAFDQAQESIRKAIAANPSHPEAYNLYGALLEIRGNHLEAVKFYRAALDIDPTFQTARSNRDRITSFHKSGTIILGPESE